MSLRLNSSGGGSVTLQEPVTANNQTLTLPDVTGTLLAAGTAISGTTGTFTGLLDISAAGAGQIRFPATMNPSADANTLDDYEEGTWTPIDVSGAGLVFSGATGFYTKVGNLVTVQMYVPYPTTSSGAAATIGGLPFGSATGTNRYSTCMLWTNSNLTLSVGFGGIGGGATAFQIRNLQNNAPANSALSNFFVIASFSYMAA